MPPVPDHMAATPPFRKALSEGIASGTLVDTKIIVFSRKNSLGGVYGPKALYANSHVLKSIPYFENREFPCALLDDNLKIVPQVFFGNFVEAESKDFDETFDDDEFSNDYDYDSDSDLEDDSPTVVDALVGVLKKVVPSKEAVEKTLRKIVPQDDTLKKALRVDSLSCLRGETSRKPSHEEYSERSDKGKVVKIPDMALIT